MSSIRVWLLPCDESKCGQDNEESQASIHSRSVYTNRVDQKLRTGTLTNIHNLREKNPPLKLIVLPFFVSVQKVLGVYFEKVDIIRWNLFPYLFIKRKKQKRQKKNTGSDIFGKMKIPVNLINVIKNFNANFYQYNVFKLKLG